MVSDSATITGKIEIRKTDTPQPDRWTWCSSTGLWSKPGLTALCPRPFTKRMRLATTITTAPPSSSFPSTSPTRDSEYSQTRASNGAKYTMTRIFRSDAHEHPPAPEDGRPRAYERTSDQRPPERAGNNLPVPDESTKC